VIFSSTGYKNPGFYPKIFWLRGFKDHWIMFLFGSCPDYLNYISREKHIDVVVVK
jgi:hypothetical protein